jgi:hypothetical protein
MGQFNRPVGRRSAILLNQMKSPDLEPRTAQILPKSLDTKKAIVPKSLIRCVLGLMAGAPDYSDGQA